MVNIQFHKFTLFSFGSIIGMILICGIIVPTSGNASYDSIIDSDVSVSTGIRNSATQYVDHEPIMVENDTALASAASSGSGSFLDPYIFENLKITNFTEAAIYIKDTTKYFVIQNCWIDGEGNNESSMGIVALMTASGTVLVQNNIVKNCVQYGIAVAYSEKSLVENNYCNNTGVGILSAGSFNEISNNLCEYNEYGFELTPYGERLSVNNRIINNSFNNNNHSGLYLTYASSTIVKENECKNNRFGVYSSMLIQTTITLNKFESNEDYGVFFNDHSENYDTKDNKFYYNTFINNALLTNHSQAFDNGTSEVWYNTNTNVGNYWSDWNGTGSYSIDGGNYTDLYPMINNDLNPPEINGPEDFYIKPKSQADIFWNCSDDYPSSFSLYLNGSEIESGSWNGSIISYPLYNISVGVHHFKLVVFDVNGFSSSDDVVVLVYPVPQDILAKIFQYPDVFGTGILAGIGGSLASMIYLRIRKRGK